MDRKPKQNLGATSRQPAAEYLEQSPKQAVALAFRDGLAALVPSGQLHTLVALFEGRASRASVQHWRDGRRQPPQWARDLLRAKLMAVGAIAERIQAAPSDFGISPNIIAWNARQRAQKEKGAD